MTETTLTRERVQAIISEALQRLKPEDHDDFRAAIRAAYRLGKLSPDVALYLKELGVIEPVDDEQDNTSSHRGARSTRAARRSLRRMVRQLERRRETIERRLMRPTARVIEHGKALNPHRRHPSSYDDRDGSIYSLVRHEVPLIFLIVDWVVDSGLAGNSHIPAHEIARGIRNAALAYHAGWKLEENEIKGPKSNKGGREHWADIGLIWRCVELLQQMKGNEPVGFSAWQAPGHKVDATEIEDDDAEDPGARRKSELAIFVEKILAFIDPNRKEMPSLNLYGAVKKRMGLTRPDDGRRSGAARGKGRKPRAKK